MTNIRILTHNLWCHYLTLKPAPNKVYRMKEFVRHISTYDILILQELFVSQCGFKVWDEAKNIVVDGAKSVDIKYLFDSDPPPYFGMNSGLVILSRFKGKKVNEVYWSPITDPGVRKGFLEAEISAPPTCSSSPSRLIRVFSVHLDAHYAESRSNQYRTLKEHIVEQYGTTDPVSGRVTISDLVIISGDFNICPTAQREEHKNLIEEFRSIGLHDLFAEINPGTFRSDGSRLDYIFINTDVWDHSGNSNLQNLSQLTTSGLDVIDLKDDQGGIVSDHLGLAVTLTLN